MPGGEKRGALKIEAKENRDKRKGSVTNLIYGFLIALKNGRTKRKRQRKK